MILVVYSHICHFCLGDSTMAFNATLFLFRLPCFFFISGWLFETVARRPLKSVVRRKFMVQIVPTFVFLLILATPEGFLSQLGALKGGYWFTFVLFEFFILYLFSVRCLARWGWLLALVVTVGAFGFASRQNHWRMVYDGHQWLSLGLDMAGFLSIAMWRYYLFFFIGTWVRRHFHDFTRLTDNSAVDALLFAGFAAIAMTDHPASPVMEFLRFAAGGVSGMLLVFTIFRKCASWLSQSQAWRSLQHVGTHTLDVYMLHYFFLPRFLLPVAPTLRSWDCLLLESGFIMSVSLVVVAICLMVSYVLRLNPLIDRFLFGGKRSSPSKVSISSRDSKKNSK